MNRYATRFLAALLCLPLLAVIFPSCGRPAIPAAKETEMNSRPIETRAASTLTETASSDLPVTANETSALETTVSQTEPIPSDTEEPIPETAKETEKETVKPLETESETVPDTNKETSALETTVSQTEPIPETAKETEKETAKSFETERETVSDTKIESSAPVPVTEPTDPTPPAPVETISLALPDDVTGFSPSFALRMLSICTGDVPQEITKAGFRLLTQRHYDKAADDASHTCAYTIARGTVLRDNVYRPVFLVSVRGTSGGEWYSNFDIAPSRDDDTAFAENFLFTAQDVFLTLKSYAAEEEDPIFLLCGHSRGAACTNLLGVLLNACYPVDNTYVYTFATPTTLHKPLTDVRTDNIFNVINPSDIVPLMPLTSWGYHRAGTDIYLPGDSEKEVKIRVFLDTIGNLAHDIPSYYNDRHALFHAGFDPEKGVTAYEFMLVMADFLAKSNENVFVLGRLILSGMLSDDSDFAPFFELVKTMSAEGDGLSSLTSLFEGHYPSVYASLLKTAYPGI